MFLKRLISVLLGVMALVAGGSGISLAADTGAAADNDKFTASEAFVRLPAHTLDLLSKSMRLDLLEYLKHDSIYSVPNTLDGLSYLVPPVTDKYLKVRITPVTELSIRILDGGKTPIVATAYTVGDSLQAADTKLQFFTPEMKEIKLEKIMRIATSEDFLNLQGLSRKEREEILFLLPFPTVEYTFNAENNDLKARLTVGEFLSREANEKIKPYLRRDRTYKWDGHKYKLEK